MHWVQSITRVGSHNGDLDRLWTLGRVQNVLGLFHAGEEVSGGTASAVAPIVCPVAGGQLTI